MKKAMIAIFMIVGCSILTLGQSINENIQHKVKVSARIIPLFALDDQGNPVLDLTQEDIFITIDKRPISPLYLLQRTFLMEQSQTPDPVENKPLAPKKPPEIPRLVFFLIDEAFMQKKSLLRTKEICQKLMEKSGRNDLFAFMGINSWKGLYYIAGPEPFSERLSEKIGRLKFSNRGTRSASAGLDVTFDDNESGVEKHQKYLSQESVLPYEWFRSVKAMKYALKAFPQPKIVFLLSSGMGSSMLWEDSFPRGFSHLKDIAKAFNESGTSVFAVNPSTNPDKLTNGREALETLTEASGGAYFSGKNLNDLVKTVKQSTSAYYELILGGDLPIKDVSKLQIDCRRPGIKIFAPQTIGRHKNYSEMNTLEQELFCIDICFGGLWSRMATRISKLDAYRLHKKEGLEECYEGFLPVDMQHQTLEVFSVRLPSGSQTPIIHKSQINAAEKIQFTFKHNSGDRIFLLAYAPGSSRSALCKLD